MGLVRKIGQHDKLASYQIECKLFKGASFVSKHYFNVMVDCTGSGETSQNDGTKNSLEKKF